MKKAILFAAVLAAGVVGAQEKGRFEVHDFDGFRLHVYYTGDALGDTSYIVEGADALVTMEQPLFRDNAAEYDAYLASLDKPVECRIADYHVGGTEHHPVTMPEGMPAFVKGDIYGGMMNRFSRIFGDAIVDMPDGETEEVAFGTERVWAGVPFVFSRGAASDFPGASILIGGRVYYTHWAPAKAHASSLQISSAAAVEAEIAEAGRALASGAELFVGGHGGAVGADAVEFRIEYLKSIAKLFAASSSAEEFAGAVKRAWPGLAGEENLAGVANALYGVE